MFNDLLALIPGLVTAIKETIEAAQAQFSNQPGHVRRKEAIEAVSAWFDLALKANRQYQFTERMITYLKNTTIPDLVEVNYQDLKEEGRV